MASVAAPVPSDASAFVTPAELDLNPDESAPIPPEVIRLHKLLDAQIALQAEYRKPRPWLFSISQTRLVNQGDTPLTLFLNLIGGLFCRLPSLQSSVLSCPSWSPVAVTDSRPLDGVAKCGASTFCRGVPYADLRTKSLSTPAISKIAVDQVGRTGQGGWRS